MKYNHNLISSENIKKEVSAFLKLPSMIAFDKHTTDKTSEYLIIRNSICCEFCFKNIIDQLFVIEGIEKDESNFNEINYYQENPNEQEQVFINIKYNQNVINIEEMKQIK